jgi:hypothetical protein
MIEFWNITEVRIIFGTALVIAGALLAKRLIAPSPKPNTKKHQ